MLRPVSISISVSKQAVSQSAAQAMEIETPRNLMGGEYGRRVLDKGADVFSINADLEVDCAEDANGAVQRSPRKRRRRDIAMIRHPSKLGLEVRSNA